MRSKKNQGLKLIKYSYYNSISKPSFGVLGFWGFGVFGALRKCIFASTNVQLDLKALIYLSIILPILLYGCECWCLTESLNRKLRNFHNQCVRAMCRVNLRHSFLHVHFVGRLATSKQNGCSDNSRSQLEIIVTPSSSLAFVFRT